MVGGFYLGTLRFNHTYPISVWTAPEQVSSISIPLNRLRVVRQQWLSAAEQVAQLPVVAADAYIQPPEP